MSFEKISSKMHRVFLDKFLWLFIGEFFLEISKKKAWWNSWDYLWRSPKAIPRKTSYKLLEELVVAFDFLEKNRLEIKQIVEIS